MFESRAWSLLTAAALLAAILPPGRAGVIATSSARCDSPLAIWSAAGPGGLGVEGASFTIDGRRQFLLGVSLFDALGPSPVRDEDLEALRRWGVSLVRVWAHWSEPVYDAEGSLTVAGRARLERLAERLEAHRLVLELVLLRPGQLRGQPFALFTGPAARVRAVREISRVLRPYRLAVFDLYNEHDHPHGPIGHGEARVLRDAVKEVDPTRLVTISSTEYHFVTQKSTLDRDGLGNLEAEVGTDPGSVAVDVLAAHLPRTPDWAQATTRRVEALRDAVAKTGRIVPVYLNEESRAQEGTRPIPIDSYLEAASAARNSGAAGWMFHTAAGFALEERSFLAALTAEERKALESLSAVLRRP